MIAAVFDVDWTILPGTSAERLFVRMLWRDGHLGLRGLARMLVGFLKYLPDTTAARAERAYLRGRSVAEMEAVALACWQGRILPRLSPAALTAIERHRRQGHAIVLLTGAPNILMQPLAMHLKADACLCSRLEQDGGRYTGRTVPPYPYGPAKRAVLERYAAEHGLDLAASWAYADSLTDLAVLERVGHPVVVNPDIRLRRLASRRGWPVEDWT